MKMRLNATNGHDIATFVVEGITPAEFREWVGKVGKKREGLAARFPDATDGEREILGSLGKERVEVSNTGDDDEKIAAFEKNLKVWRVDDIIPEEDVAPSRVAETVTQPDKLAAT